MATLADKQREIQLALIERNKKALAAKADQDFFDDVFTISTSFGEGFNRGLANVVGLPVDLVNGVLGLVGMGSDNPVGGSKQLRSVMSYFGTTPENEFVGRIGEEFGATVAPVAGAVSRVGRATSAVGKALTAPFEGRLARGLATETAITAGAGAGAAVANQQAPGSVASEIVGQVAGGFGATAALDAPRAAVNVARTARNLIRPAVSGKARTGAVLRGAVEDDLDDVLFALDTAPKGATTAQATNNPALLNIERGLSRQEPRAFQQVRTDQNQQLRQISDRALASGTAGDAGRAQTILRDRQTRILDAIDNATNDVEIRAQQKINKLRTRPSKAEANAVVRKEFDDLMQGARAEESKLWESVGNESVDIREVKDFVGSVMAGADAAVDPATIPSVYRMDLFDPEDFDIVGLQKLVSIRKRIGRERRVERAKPAPNRARIRNLNELDDVLLSSMDTLKTSKPAYDQARMFSKQLNDRFTRGTVAKIFGSDARGMGFRESQLLDTMLRDPDAVDDMLRAAGDNESIISAAKNYMVDDFADSVSNYDGTFNANKAKAWFRTHKDVVDRFPDVKEEITSLISTKDRANSLVKTRAATEKRIRQSALATFLDVDPDRAINAVLSGNNPRQKMKLLVKSLNNEETAIDGLKNSFWEHFNNSVGIHARDLDGYQFVAPAKLRKFMDKNRGAMEELYGKTHVKMMDQMVDLSDIFNRSQTVPLGGGTSTAQDILSAVSIPQILGRAYNVKRGVVSPFFVTAEAGSRFLHRFIGIQTQDSAQKLLHEAMINPEVAKTLLMQITPATEKQIISRLRGHLLNIGVKPEDSE